ncbi:MAG: hypothetical protein AAF351_11665 [Pseudomonadota bacterium]
MTNEPTKKPLISDRVKREVAVFSLLLFFGLAVMPFAIYFVGQNVFGAFEGAGFGDFFGSISARFRAFDPAAWFLVLSPYLIWQLIRLSWFGWRRLGPAPR